MLRAANSLILSAALVGSPAFAACDKPLYLTFDTGHMGVAPLVAEVLARQQVQVTFFLANEKTLTDGTSLDMGDWRFNLRASNTEALVRLNVETRGRPIEPLVAALTSQILAGQESTLP